MIDYLDELHKELLDILIQFDLFCKENDIRYFLEGGTALGALRHKGFIPWDDDIDVGMFREDYTKLLESLSYLPEDLIVRTSDNTVGFAPMFAKLCRKNTEFITQETKDSGFNQEIFIDIFIYDSLVKNKKEQKRQIRNARLWQSISYLYNSPHISVLPGGVRGFLISILARLIHFVLHRVLTQQYINKKFDRSVCPNGERIDAYVPLSYTQAKPLSYQYFFPCRIENFEGKMMPVPHMVEEYLENLYGNWETIPPIEERHTHMPMRVVFSNGKVWEGQNGIK